MGIARYRLATTKLFAGYAKKLSEIELSMNIEFEEWYEEGKKDCLKSY
jgi:hypothetical protein